jgi:uncharacterized protein YbaP (TraB family)
MIKPLNQWFRICGVLLGGLLLSAAAQADSPVWKVSKGERYLYLGGTFHMLAASDYPLPAGFDKAYADASVLVFETDIRALRTPLFRQQLMHALMFADGQTLQAVIRPQTYSDLRDYLQSRQMDIGQFDLFKPALVTLSLTLMELHRLGLDSMGVDQHYSQLADRDQKPFRQLETLDQQVAFLATMAEGREDDLLTYTLRDMLDLPTTIELLRSAWREGDIQGLEGVGLVGMMKDFPTVYTSLVLNRNRAWLPEIEAMLADEAVELVLVGGLHLAGEDGLLKQLQQRGYTLQQLD